MSGVNDPKTNTEFLGIPLSVPVLTAPFGGDALFAPDGHLAVARANAAGRHRVDRARGRQLLLRGGRRRGPGGRADRPAAPVRLLRRRGRPDQGGRLRGALRDRGLPDRRLPGQEPDGPLPPRPGDLARQRHRRRLAQRRRPPSPPGSSPAGPGTSSPRRPPATACRGSPRASSPPRRPRPPSTRARRRSWSPTTAAARSTRRRPASTSCPRSPPQVGGRVPVLLDSGVRTGADVFLALALGASRGGHRPPGRLRARGGGRARRPPHHRAAGPGTAHPDDPGGRPRHRRRSRPASVARRRQPGTAPRAASRASVAAWQGQSRPTPSSAATS